MKKSNALIAAAALAVFAGSVNADTLSFGTYVGKIDIKLSNEDTGVIYSGADGTYTAAQIAAANAAAAADISHVATVGGLTADRRNLGAVASDEDAWGVLVVTDIYKHGLPHTAANRLFQDSATSEITAIFFGQSDSFLKISNSGATEEIHSTGLDAAFFYDSGGGVTAYDPGPGPGGRTNPGGKPTYSTVTDGTLLWTMKSTTGFSGAGGFTPDPTGEFFTNVGITAGTVTGVNGSGGFNAKMDNSGLNPWGVGTENYLLDPTTAITVSFTGTGATDPSLPAPQWLINSEDPIIADAVAAPLPATAYTALICLAGFGLAQSRRRRVTK